jgi:predicted dehydrogenase
LEKLSAAVIGCGRMGAFTSESVIKYAPDSWLPLSHIEAIGAHERLNLVAISDTDESALNKTASFYEVSSKYENPYDLIDKEELSLLSIATRTPGRSSLIEYSIDNDIKAIHIEKPLCNSAKELLNLERLIKRDDIYITYGTLRRFLPIYKQACDLANSGKFGKLNQVKFNSGLAPLFWTHPHSIDLILYAAGRRKVVGVQAKLLGLKTEGENNEIISDPLVDFATIHFDDGLLGVLDKSIGLDFKLICEDAEIIVRADGRFIEIYNTEGLNPYPKRSRLEPLPTDSKGGTYFPIAELVNCIEGDSLSIIQNNINKHAIIKGQKIIFSMIYSNFNDSKVVSFDHFDPNIYVHALTSGKPA